VFLVFSFNLNVFISYVYDFICESTYLLGNGFKIVIVLILKQKWGATSSTSFLFGFDFMILFATKQVVKVKVSNKR
jgi:hypothetical protein